MNDKKKISVLDVRLVEVRDDVDSPLATRLVPAKDVVGEQMMRSSTIEAIRSLIEVRDLAFEIATSHEKDRGSLLRDLRLVFGLPVEVETVPGGDVSATIVVEGQKNETGTQFEISEVKSIELIRQRKEIGFPFYLVEGDRLVCTVVVLGTEGKSDEVIGRSETIAGPGGRDISEIRVESPIHLPVPTRFAEGCSTCGRGMDSVRPAVEETEESSPGTPRRWKCVSCVMEGLVPSGSAKDVLGKITPNGVAAELPEVDPSTDPEKFDETTGPVG